MTTRRGSVRRHVHINCPPDAVWDLVGRPERVQEWFPGISSSTVDGSSRTITTGSGIPMLEQIVTHDPIARRFQYRITAPLFREHLSTIDVLELEDGSSVVVYAADAAPSTMALVVGGAAGNALENLRTILEGGR